MQARLEPGAREEGCSSTAGSLLTVDSCRCRSVLKWLIFSLSIFLYFSLSFLFLRLLPFSFQFFAFQDPVFSFSILTFNFWRGVVSAGCYHVTILKMKMCHCVDLITLFLNLLYNFYRAVVSVVSEDGEAMCTVMLLAVK